MSMKGNFSMNPDWERQLASAIAPRMRELVRRLQTAVDDLRPVYEGKPIEEIMPAVQQAWANTNDGAQIAYPDLTEYADAIRIGRPVEIRYYGIKK
jgi:hypothetical protein